MVYGPLPRQSTISGGTPPLVDDNGNVTYFPKPSRGGGGGSGGGGSTITKSTPTNQAEVQAQFAAQEAARKAQQSFQQDIKRVTNFNQLSAAARNVVISNAQRRAENKYNQEVKLIYDRLYPTNQKRITGTVEPYVRPKGGFVSENLKIGLPTGKKISLAQLSSILSKAYQKQRSKKGQLSGAAATALGVVRGAVGQAAALADLPQAGYNVLRTPKLLLQLPSVIKSQAKDFGVVAKQNPGYAVGYFAGNVVGMYGSSKAIDYISELSKLQLTKLSSKYIGDLDTGDVVKIPAGKGRSVTLKVVGKIPKSAIKKQIELAGKQIPYATSSQSNKLLGFIRRGKFIRKPIPGEEGFTIATKKLLRKLDRGTIKRSELSRLQSLVRKQGGKGVLERSFFASPGGEVRPSRLGILPKEKASISDYFLEDITFKRNKPQVLVFKDVKVSDFPSSLRKIVKKIKAGKSLTQKESGKLLRFQLSKTGKFKPLGFISGEKEITLAPGELVRRKKTLGRAIIKDRSVTIVEAEVVKPPKVLKNLIKKAEKGTIKPKELNKLDKLLKKKTGFDYDLSGYKKGGRYVNLKAIGASLSSKVLKRYNYKGKFISASKYKGLSSKAKYKVKIIKYSPKKYSTSKTSLSSPFKSTTRSPIRYPIKFPRVANTPKIPEKLRLVRGSKPKPKLSRAVQTYNVYGKVGRKFVKINKGVLTLKDALNKGSYAIDNTTAKTFKVVRAGKRKTVYGVPQQEQGYFNKANYKLRPYRIKRGRKFVVKPKYIEKRRYGIDTRGEKRGLTLARYLKGRGIKRRNVIRSPKPRRRISPKQRKVLLKNLKKARRVLARKRR